MLIDVLDLVADEDCPQLACQNLNIVDQPYHSVKVIEKLRVRKVKLTLERQDRIFVIVLLACLDVFFDLLKLLFCDELPPTGNMLCQVFDPLELADCFTV